MAIDFNSTVIGSSIFVSLTTCPSLISLSTTLAFLVSVFNVAAMGTLLIAYL